MATERFCTFLVDGELLGAPATRVQEVIPHPEVTRVPLAHTAVSGLTNLRGQIVLAIDLRRRLRIPDRSSSSPPVHVVVRVGDHPVSLIVDEIGDIVELAGENCEHPPETVPAYFREVIVGIYKLPDKLLLALDIDRITCLDGLQSDS